MILLVAFALALFVLPAPWGAVAVVGAAAVEVAEVWFWFRWSKRRRVAVGLETLVGRRAIATTSCRPRGQARIAGELWAAHCEMGADPGDPLEVVSVDPGDLTLHVVRVAG